MDEGEQSNYRSLAVLVRVLVRQTVKQLRGGEPVAGRKAEYGVLV